MWSRQLDRPRSGRRAARAGNSSLTRPSPPNRRYEALRAYLLEGASAAAAAARFGYTEATLASLVRDFRAGRREFFRTPKPGPKTAPAKERARPRVIELRRAGRSAYEIAQTLAAEGIPLNRTGARRADAVNRSGSVSAEGLPAVVGIVTRCF
jgi:transposase-like protein